jgi:hypothetical protein
MPVLHVANTSFEEEIEKNLIFPDSVQSHPMYLQLQFLPFLYGEEEDLVLTTSVPEAGYFERLKALGLRPPKMTHTMPEKSFVNCWGVTASVSKWAKDNHLILDGPVPETVKKVNSKVFSFLHAPKLKNSALLHNFEELISWFDSFSGKKVLKTCYGVSGKGHFHLHSLNDPSLLAYAKREWEKNLPLIAEPWVERQMDFSTQWYLHKDGSKDYIGFTICENDSRGHYLGTIIGTKEPEQLKEHITTAEKVLNEIKKEGYFGHVGFDAMIYENGNLHPIVEINARKTMGWVALAFHSRYFPHRSLAIRLTKKTQKIGSLLPTSTNKICFQRQLCVDFIEK